MDLTPGARNVIQNCLGVRQEESTLILTDTQTHDIGRALFRVAEGQNARAVFVEMPSTKGHHEEPIEQISKLMPYFDVIAIASQFSMTHTRARHGANRAGARIASLASVTPESMATGGMTANYFDIMKRIQAIYRKVRFKNKLRVESDLGTNITFKVTTGRWILDDTGICHHRGMVTTLPAGEIFVSPVEGSAEGAIVFDQMFGTVPISKPIEVTVASGYATRFSRTITPVRDLEACGVPGRNVAEFGIGLNPKSPQKRNIIEAEKALGTVNMSFGDNSRYGGRVSCEIHRTGTLSKADVYAGSMKIIEDGNLLI
jgi:leucyl aminopeptidase (aminopeptidase T)